MAASIHRTIMTQTTTDQANMNPANMNQANVNRTNMPIYISGITMPLDIVDWEFNHNLVFPDTIREDTIRLLIERTLRSREICTGIDIELVYTANNTFSAYVWPTTWYQSNTNTNHLNQIVYQGATYIDNPTLDNEQWVLRESEFITRGDMERHNNIIRNRRFVQ